MLREEAMIVRLSISQWTARKFDKAVSQRVATDYAVDVEVGRYNKILIAKEAIQDITKAVSAARTFHYENTLPWDDGGGRILPSKNFLTYSKEMRKFNQGMDDAVKAFMENYDEYREEARRRLNGMFKEADYPGHREIGRKFGFSVDIEPVPSAEDFRVTLQSKDATRIKKQLEARINERVVEATKDLFVRLSGVVKKFAEKLADKDAIFRDSLVENIVELVNLLPKLNIANDPELEKLRKEVQKKVCAFEPDTLRESEEVRSKAASDAQAILNKMSGYMKR
jgi:hypothetical protein